MRMDPAAGRARIGWPGDFGLGAGEIGSVSSEVKTPVRAHDEPALLIMVERPRLPWPAAALIILGLSVAGWAAVALLMSWLLN